MDPTIVARVLEMAIRIQQIPSPTFEEGKRARFIYEQFLSMGASNISMDGQGNLFVRIVGAGVKPPLVISAHLDTVFPSKADISYRRTEESIFGPGIGDNSLGLAGLFGLFWYFSGDRGDAKGTSLPGDVWLVANVGEEGLGDLKGMKTVVGRFESKVMAYLVLEGMSLGQIYTRGLGVRRYRIRVGTRGGHAWTDYGSPSAIHEIAELVTRLKSIPISGDPRSSLNVGMIEGGTSVNTIAAHASLELDLRSESTQELNHLVDQVEQLVIEMNDRSEGGVRVDSEVIGDRPAGEIPVDHVLVRTAVACFAKEGIAVKLNAGSTDANVPLSRGYPAVCLGLTTGGGAHTSGEFIQIAPVEQGMRVLVDLVNTLYKTSNQS